MQTLKKFQKLSAKVLVFLTILTAFCLTSIPVFADPICTDNTPSCAGPSGNSTTPTTASDPNCNNSSDAGVQKCLKNNQIVKDLNVVVDFLSAGVAIVVIGVIILGGIQYSLAGDNATATGAAKKRITDGLIALVAFIFTFAFLQWLIPGGL